MKNLYDIFRYLSLSGLGPDSLHEWDLMGDSEFWYILWGDSKFLQNFAKNLIPKKMSSFSADRDSIWMGGFFLMRRIGKFRLMGGIPQSPSVNTLFVDIYRVLVDFSIF